MSIQSIIDAPNAAPELAAKAAEAAGSFWGKNDTSFKNVLDIINPLQHIPIVSSIYRELSGDTISSGARIFGDALMGGPLGFVSALLNEITQSATGKDIGGNVIAWLENKPATQVAQAYEKADKLT